MDGGGLYLVKPHQMDVSIFPQACHQRSGWAPGNTVAPVPTVKRDPNNPPIQIVINNQGKINTGNSVWYAPGSSLSTWMY